MLGAAGAPDPDFDVISEFVFADREAYEAMIATHARPEVAAAIEADEEKFLAAHVTGCTSSRSTKS